MSLNIFSIVAADAGPIEAEFPSEINGCKKITQNVYTSSSQTSNTCRDCSMCTVTQLIYNIKCSLHILYTFNILQFFMFPLAPPFPQNISILSPPPKVECKVCSYLQKTMSTARQTLCMSM